MILLKYHFQAFHQQRSVHTLEGHPSDPSELTDSHSVVHHCPKALWGNLCVGGYFGWGHPFWRLHWVWGGLVFKHPGAFWHGGLWRFSPCRELCCDLDLRPRNTSIQSYVKDSTAANYQLIYPQMSQRTTDAPLYLSHIPLISHLRLSFFLNSLDLVWFLGSFNSRFCYFYLTSLF